MQKSSIALFLAATSALAISYAENTNVKAAENDLGGLKEWNTDMPLDADFKLDARAQELADEAEKIFSLVEKRIPLQLISSDYAENPKNLITEELTIKEILDHAKNIIDYYIKQGLSVEDSYDILKGIDIFRENWESIKDSL